MYIELEQDFKCRLIELFHYILKIRDKNCKGNKLNKSIDVREMYEYSKGLRSACSFILYL